MKIFVQFLILFLSIILISCNPSSPQPSRKNQPVRPKNKMGSAPTSKNIDSARKASYMSSREKDMIKEINLIRSNPKGYIPIVEAYIKDQEAQMSQIISGKEYVRDEIKTAKELIKELRKTSPMSILQPNEGVYKAAKIHGIEGKKKGSLNHVGSNGSWPWDRIKKHAGFANGGENLVGGLSDVRESVMVLLVDSGIDGRGHRKALLNPQWSYVACYEVGQVGTMPHYWVQNFAN